MICMPPLEIVVLVAVPELTTCVPPFEIVVPLADPPLMSWVALDPAILVLLARAEV
jgi:hypothetical protein